MIEGDSVDLESRTAYLGRFGVLKDSMLKGASAIAYLRQPLKNPSLILTTSESINSSSLANLAKKIELYDSLLSYSEEQQDFKRPSLQQLGIHDMRDPYFFDTEDMVDWLRAYSNYLSDKNNPSVITNSDILNFERAPLSSEYKIVNPNSGAKLDAVVESLHSASTKILYSSFLVIAKGLEKINSAYAIFQKVDTYLDKKIFDKFKVNSSGKFDDFWTD